MIDGMVVVVVGLVTAPFVLARQAKAAARLWYWRSGSRTGCPWPRRAAGISAKMKAARTIALRHFLSLLRHIRRLSVMRIRKSHRERNAVDAAAFMLVSSINPERLSQSQGETRCCPLRSLLRIPAAIFAVAGWTGAAIAAPATAIFPFEIYDTSGEAAAA